MRARAAGRFVIDTVESGRVNVGRRIRAADRQFRDLRHWRHIIDTIGHIDIVRSDVTFNFRSNDEPISVRAYTWSGLDSDDRADR